MDAAELQSWFEWRDEKDDALYERFGRPLEIEHGGEFVAIADDGRIVLAADELAVAHRALEEFGSGGFALRRIGAPAEMSWRTSR